MLEGTSVEYNEAAYNATRAPEPYSQSWNEAVLERLELEQAMAASLLTATMPYNAHVQYTRILEAQALGRQNRSHIARAQLTAIRNNGICKSCVAATDSDASLNMAPNAPGGFLHNERS